MQQLFSGGCKKLLGAIRIHVVLGHQMLIGYRIQHRGIRGQCRNRWDILTMSVDKGLGNNLHDRYAFACATIISSNRSSAHVPVVSPNSHSPMVFPLYLKGNSTRAESAPTDLS